MWCESCREDVPGFAASGVGRVCCARCGTPVGSDLRREASSVDAVIDAEKPAGVEAVVQAPRIDMAENDRFGPASTSTRPRRHSEPPLALDDWELDLEWRRLRGLAGAATAPF